MPPLAPIHRPQFTEEQLAHARQLAARTTAPHREVLRARLTLVLAAEPGLTHRQVATRAGLSPKTVEKWRRRWASEGWSLTDAPRSGRPPTFSPPDAPGGESPRL